jgi:hypothetical protein
MDWIARVRFLAEERFFSSPQHPDWLRPTHPSVQWVLGSLSSDWGMKLATYLHLVPKSRIVELYLHSPICLQAIMLN